MSKASNKRSNKDNPDDKKEREEKKQKVIENVTPLRIGALYTHKGGVGKTTMVVNVAREIAKKTKKKILVIDADPQMNLTSWVMTDNEFNKHLEEESRKVKETKTPGSIMELYYAHNDYKMNPIKHKELSILPGSFEDFDLETNLSLALFRKNKSDLQFKLLRERMRNHNQYDLILLDMSPTLSPLNVSLLLSCDFMVNVVTGDVFCEKSFELQNINLFSRFTNTEMGDMLPKHCGFIMNKCRIQSEDLTRDTQEFRTKFNRTCKRFNDSTCIGWLEDLAGMSSRLHLDKVDLIDYNESDQNKSRRVKEQFVLIVNNLIKIISGQ